LFNAFQVQKDAINKVLLKGGNRRNISQECHIIPATVGYNTFENALTHPLFFVDKKLNQNLAKCILWKINSLFLKILLANSTTPPFIM